MPLHGVESFHHKMPVLGPPCTGPLDIVRSPGDPPGPHSTLCVGGGGVVTSMINKW